MADLRVRNVTITKRKMIPFKEEIKHQSKKTEFKIHLMEEKK